MSRVAKSRKVTKGILNPDQSEIGWVGKVAPPYKGATFLTLTPDLTDVLVDANQIETEIPRNQASLDHSLRLLARWLVSAARKRPPVADLSPSVEPQIGVDVGRDPKVESNSEANEMPVQQAFQRRDRR